MREASTKPFDWSKLQIAACVEVNAVAVPGATGSSWNSGPEIPQLNWTELELEPPATAVVPLVLNTCEPHEVPETREAHQYHRNPKFGDSYREKTDFVKCCN
ncbi:hypothetical protein J6590_101476 [Homalodisca vitripennis]|nr:hypothetical protein J6590_101476 [Homalodisca vitripennis]